MQMEGSTGHRTEQPASINPFHFKGRALPVGTLLTGSKGCSNPDGGEGPWERSSTHAKATETPGQKTETSSTVRNLVRPQDYKLQKGLASPEGGKSYTPWIFQDGPDYHHLGLTWSYFKATDSDPKDIHI